MLAHHPPPQETGPLPMEGSVLVAVGESEEEVLSVVREDAYVKAGVWDLERVRVIPVSRNMPLFLFMTFFFFFKKKKKKKNLQSLISFASMCICICTCTYDICGL